MLLTSSCIEYYLTTRDQVKADRGHRRRGGVSEYGGDGSVICLPPPPPTYYTTYARSAGRVLSFLLLVLVTVAARRKSGANESFLHLRSIRTGNRLRLPFLRGHERGPRRHLIASAIASGKSGQKNRGDEPATVPRREGDKSKMPNLASSPGITYRTPDMAERSCHDSHAVFQVAPQYHACGQLKRCTCSPEGIPLFFSPSHRLPMPVRRYGCLQPNLRAYQRPGAH